MWRSRCHGASNRSAGGGRLRIRALPEPGQEKIQIVRADVFELREDALDHAPLPALAVVLAAVERRIARYLEGDAEGAKQGLGHTGVVIERLEAKRPGVMDHQPRVVDGNPSERREGGLDHGEIAQAKRAEHDRRSETPGSLEMGNQLQSLARGRLRRNQSDGGALARLEHQVAREPLRQVAPFRSMISSSSVRAVEYCSTGTATASTSLARSRATSEGRLLLSFKCSASACRTRSAASRAITRTISSAIHRSS